MMEYEVFKVIVVNEFKSYLPEELQKYELVLREVDKVNEKLDGITLKGTKDADLTVCPTMYIQDLYRNYNQIGDLNEVLTKAANTFAGAFAEGKGMEEKLEYAKAKDNIVFQLINTEQNKEYLAERPHRDFNDLSVVYRWVVSLDGDGVQSVAIDNNMAGRLGCSEEDLFAAAMENTKRIFTPTVNPIVDFIKDMSMSDEMREMLFQELPADNFMYVFTNSSGVHGATTMMYEEKFHELAEKMESDLYILPSSVHEVIAISTKMGTPEELAKMVKEVNMTQVDLCDRLSNQVYHYDRNARTITMATHTPDIRLDFKSPEEVKEKEPRAKSI